METTFQQELFELMKKYAELEKTKPVYINPHVLSEISGLLCNYYNLEDYAVDKWINNMWSW